MEDAEKQGMNRKLEAIKPYQWKKGQSGNIMGRPKGKTMKDYVREYLSKMTDDERDEWLEGIDKIELFRMSEGNPHSTNDLTTNGKELPTPILNYVPSDNSNKEDSIPKEAD